MFNPQNYIAIAFTKMDQNGMSLVNLEMGFLLRTSTRRILEKFNSGNK